MVYLESFEFPTADDEFKFFMDIQRTCYDSFYPFQILSKRNFRRIDFEPVTVLYGGNGSGKTTALNVIAKKIGIGRETVYNRSSFFEDYLMKCRFKFGDESPKQSRMITSDDVFDYMLNLRTLNGGIDFKREDLFDEYINNKFTKFQMHSLEDYEQLKKINSAKSKTQSKYVRANMPDNVREYSNGESALRYFTEHIKEGGLYLLDEPENSLSVEKQIEMAEFLEDAVRFYGCQLVIATHSPFLLSVRDAKIYDLDENPVDVKPWTQLPNVRTFYDFFKQHEDEF